MAASDKEYSAFIPLYSPDVYRSVFTGQWDVTTGEELLRDSIGYHSTPDADSVAHSASVLRS